MKLGRAVYGTCDRVALRIEIASYSAGCQLNNTTSQGREANPAHCIILANGGPDGNCGASSAAFAENSRHD